MQYELTHMTLRITHTGTCIQIMATWIKIPLFFALPINLAELNDAFKFRNSVLGHSIYIILALKVPN